MGRAKGGVTDRIAKALDRLESRFGKPLFASRFAPMDELVSCILSQHTADVNSFPAFDRLKAKYPSWQQVVDAGPEHLADVVRKAGLANQKSKSIISALVEIKRRNGDYTLDNLRCMTMLEARDWLTTLPGVGPKTASIVLCFAFGMAAIPVDTHIYRVSKRLGFVPEKADEKKAHDILLGLVSEKDAYRYHMLIIQHGRQTCKAQRPRCGECTLLDLCPYGKKAKGK